MWAGSVVLRLGAARDVLVAVQADSAASLAALRILLADWIDDDAAAQLEDTNPALKVHLAPAPEGARGLRTVPHLRHGSDVLARSTDPSDVLHALASVLGGIHERRPGDGRHWANLRLFAQGDRAVLGYVPRPHLVADRTLAAHQISERVNWGVELLDDGRVGLPDPLPAQWGAISMAPPLGLGELRIAGAVLFEPMSSTPAEHLASLATASTSTRWFAVLSGVVEQGQLAVASDRPSAAAAVRQRLS